MFNRLWVPCSSRPSNLMTKWLIDTRVLIKTSSLFFCSVPAGCLLYYRWHPGPAEHWGHALPLSRIPKPSLSHLPLLTCSRIPCAQLWLKSAQVSLRLQVFVPQNVLHALKVEWQLHPLEQSKFKVPFLQCLKWAVVESHKSFVVFPVKWQYLSKSYSPRYMLTW